MNYKICKMYECKDRARYTMFCWILGMGPSPEVYAIDICGTHHKEWPEKFWLFPFALRHISQD